MGEYNLSELTRVAGDDTAWSGALAAETKAVVIINSLSAIILVNLSAADPSVEACDVVVPPLSRVVFPTGAANAIAVRTMYIGARLREGVSQALIYESDAPLAPRTDLLGGPSQGSALILGGSETITAAGSPIAVPDTPQPGRRALMLQAPVANTDVVHVGDYAAPFELWPGDVIVLPVHDRIDVWASVSGVDQDIIWMEL